MLGSLSTAVCFYPPPLGESRVALSASRRVFLNELTDFGPGSGDITGTASELPAVYKCTARWSRDAENTEFFQARNGNQKRGASERPGPGRERKSKSEPSSINSVITSSLVQSSLHPACLTSRQLCERFSSVFTSPISRFYGCF